MFISKKCRNLSNRQIIKDKLNTKKFEKTKEVVTDEKQKKSIKQIKIEINALENNKEQNVVK